MKIAPIGFLALLMVLGTLHAAGATLSPGQSIGISFGATPPDNSFNHCDPDNPEIALTGSLSHIIDTNGREITGLNMHFEGANISSYQGGTPEAAAYYTASGFTTLNVQNAISGYDLAFSFLGLDLNLMFTLDLLSFYIQQNIGTEFFCNGQNFLTDSTSTTGGAEAHFTNLVPDANGTITIRLVGHDPLHPCSNRAGINCALLTVQDIPEPSTWALAMVGITGILLAHRRR